MLNIKNGRVNHLFIALLFLLFSTTSCVITVGPSTPKQQAQANRPPPVKKDRATLEKEFEKLKFFPMSRTAFEKDYKRRYDPFKITSLPFFLISDLTLLPSNTTQYLSLKAQLQQSAAAWSNPNSMIAKARTPIR